MYAIGIQGIAIIRGASIQIKVILLEMSKIRRSVMFTSDIQISYHCPTTTSPDNINSIAHP
jgi:hypothetical protein